MQSACLQKKNRNYVKTKQNQYCIDCFFNNNINNHNNNEIVTIIKRKANFECNNMKLLTDQLRVVRNIFFLLLFINTQFEEFQGSKHKFTSCSLIFLSVLFIVNTPPEEHAQRTPIKIISQQHSHYAQKF